MNKGTVQIGFTKGFGNNLFQYCFARLLAETNDLDLSTAGLPQIGIKNTQKPPAQLPTIHITDTRNDSDDLSRLYHNKKNVNYILKGYFEDYRLYKSYLAKIKTWFPQIKKQNTDDLIIHMRLQNRLVQLGHHKNFINSKGYIKAIEKFKYKRLHIVTDAAKWEHHNQQDILIIQKECKKGPNPAVELVPTQQSIDYINELIDGLKQYNPIIHCAGAQGTGMIKGYGAHRDNYINDFNLIRSFDKIIVYNSTFAWWAATLSHATKIGVFKPWKPAKITKNKNLGQTDYPGWFGWGDTTDFYLNQGKQP